MYARQITSEETYTLSEAKRIINEEAKAKRERILHKVKQKIVGDVLFEEVSNIVDNISPVPFGVGSITTSILFNHLALAFKRSK